MPLIALTPFWPSVFWFFPMKKHKEEGLRTYFRNLNSKVRPKWGSGYMQSCLRVSPFNFSLMNFSKVRKILKMSVFHVFFLSWKLYLMAITILLTCDSRSQYDENHWFLHVTKVEGDHCPLKNCNSRCKFTLMKFTECFWFLFSCLCCYGWRFKMMSASMIVH